MFIWFLSLKVVIFNRVVKTKLLCIQNGKMLCSGSLFTFHDSVCNLFFNYLELSFYFLLIRNLEVKNVYSLN